MKKEVDTLIHAQWIITGEDQVLENHTLVLKNGKIAAILSNDEAVKQYSAKETEKFPSHAIIPGLINTHTHLAMNYFRGMADDLSLMNWLKNHIWPAEKKWLSHAFVYDASLLAMAEMIRSGTTCFNDMFFFLQATAEAADKAGLRANIGITVMDFPTNWAQTPDDYFARGLEFFQHYKHHEKIRATLAPHAPYTVCDESMLRVKEMAETHHLKINLHLHETADEVNQSLAEIKKRPIRRLHELGMLSPRLIAIHMTQLNEEDLEIVAQDKPNVVHCPESNMKLASGICPVEKLRALGINVALGTDGAASNNDLNMLGEMRTANFLAKLVSHDPEALPALDTLQIATRNGAKALGIDEITGSLAPGKSADFAVINLDEIETQPLYHPVSHIVYAASRHQVTDTWVAGKQLMKNRQLLTLDEKELIHKAKLWQKKIS
ncbi:MAG TPA: TRZ/ATZ family hydrolase [Gammaproteobacteria bacterium]|nr:TRZ/ATZ family hydrolase [Gammaproteobacteria bacterium]